MSAIRAAACSLGLLLALSGLGAATAVPAGAQLSQHRQAAQADSGSNTFMSIGAARTWLAVVDGANSGASMLGPVVDRRSGHDVITPEPGDLPGTGRLAARDDCALISGSAAEREGAVAVLPASRAPPALAA